MSKATNRKRRKQWRNAAAANRIDGLPRAPLGRISKAKSVKPKRDELTQREMDANLRPVREARIRHHGAKLVERDDKRFDVDSPLWGGAIGRLYLQKKINAKQMEAMELYRKRVYQMRDELELREIAGSTLGRLYVRDAAERRREAANMVFADDRTEQEKADARAKAIDQHREIVAVLKELTRTHEGRDAWRALNRVALEGDNMEDAQLEPWLGAARVACNEIHRRFIA